MNYRYVKSLAEFDLETVNRDMENLCEENDLPAAKLFIMQLVAEELITNIIKYGSRTGENNSAEVEIHSENGAIVLTISDNTAAFNPLAATEPDITLSAEERDIGGLGLFLVRKKVKSLSYENKDGLNVVTAVIV